MAEILDEIHVDVPIRYQYISLGHKKFIQCIKNLIVRNSIVQPPNCMKSVLSAIILC